MNSIVTRIAKISPLVIIFGLAACKPIPNSDHLTQEAGDILNPDGRRREARVAGEATAAAEAATATALKANEMAQANLAAAVKAKAEAEKVVIDAKVEAAKAAIDLKAKESLLPPEKAPAAASNPK